MIRGARQEDKPSLRLLWDKCFPGEPEFATLFFERMYKEEFCRVFDVDGVPVAMIHAFPYTLYTPDNTLSAYYIYGVGCDPQYRGRGYAGSLVENTVARGRQFGFDLCMLIPQSSGLFDYYDKFGFSPVFYTETVDIKVGEQDEPGLVSSATERDLYFINFIYENALDSYIYAKRDNLHWEMLLHGAKCGNGDISVVRLTQGICAYAVYYVKDKALIISEMFSKREDIYEALPVYLANCCGCTEIKLLRPGGCERMGAAYIISGKADKAFKKTPAYLNLMHN